MDGIFGSKHLIGLAFCGGYAAVFFLITSLFVNKRGEKARIYALRVLYFVLLFLEMAKYILAFRRSGHIGHGIFPWHLCSMPLYLFPFVAFGKSKFAEFLKPGAFMIGLLGGLVALVYPSNILDNSIGWLDNWGYNFPMISFLYHSTMIIFAVYMLTSKLYKPKAIDALKSFIVLFVLAMIAIFLNWAIPGADYFLLGKGYGSPLAFIIEKAGKFVYILTMMGAAALLISLLYSVPIVMDIINRRKKRNISTVIADENSQSQDEPHNT